MTFYIENIIFVRPFSLSQQLDFPSYDLTLAFRKAVFSASSIIFKLLTPCRFRIISPLHTNNFLTSSENVWKPYTPRIFSPAKTILAGNLVSLHYYNLTSLPDSFLFDFCVFSSSFPFHQAGQLPGGKFPYQYIRT